MQKLFLTVAITVVLALSAYWLHTRHGWTVADAVGCVSLLGVASALTPFIVEKWRGRTCEVSNPYVELGSNEGWFKFHFEAYVLNAGSESDVLKNVRYAFYHRRSGRFPLSLIFGAQEVGSKHGHILPFPLNQGKSYFVEARERFMWIALVAKGYRLMGTNLLTTFYYVDLFSQNHGQ